MSIDTVNDLTPRNQYVASAAQTDFDYTFPIFQDADLVVDKDGVVLTLSTHYTVSGAGDDTGGTVTLVTPATGGEIITVYREMVIERTTDFSQNGPFASRDFNDELDRLTLIMQDLRARVNRSLRIPFNAPVESGDIEFSPIENWYDRYVFINGSGVPEPAVSVDPTVLTQTGIGDLLYPTTAAETLAGVTVVRSYYPPGYLKRYTANNGDGSDISAAFEAMLNCGEKLCFVHAPTSTWGIGTQIDWVAGVTVKCGRGTSFTSTRSSGQWAFVFDGVPYGVGAGFEGFILNVTNAGAHGIQLWECRNVHLRDFEVLGPAGIGGTGVEINGGDDASPTYGAAHNHLSNFRVYRMAKGLNLYTDNTTTPADTTAFSNRNFVFGAQLQTCTEGLTMDRAATNEMFGLSLQANTEGADLGQFARKNTLHIIPENNTRAIVMHASATDNCFMGTVQNTDFVNASGVATAPHLSTKILSAQDFSWTRDITMPPGGAVRFNNPFGASQIRMRVGDTYDVDLMFGSHDASDTNFDLATCKYHATAPYWQFERAAVMKRVAITYSASMDTDASLGNLFSITATNGTAFAINAPTNPQTGQFITYVIRNTSGGALGTVTWNAVFKMSTWTSPATGNSRSITFQYNGTNWVQASQTGVDVPN